MKKILKKITTLWQILGRVNEGINGIDLGPGVPSMFEGDDKKYLVDFRADRFLTTNGMVSVMPSSYGALYTTTEESGPQEGHITTQKTVKVAVKPKDVLAELGRIPTNWSLEGLDAKIAILKSKHELLTQKFAKEEVEGLMLCLENRKKWDVVSKVAGTTYREWFGRFDATSQLKIDALTDKHDLTMKPADIFIPEFPDDATTLMTTCTKLTEELCGKKPRLYVIANDSQFRDAFGKRDPILLAQSPFGFYYYILGAWDSEMILLSEL